MKQISFSVLALSFLVSFCSATEKTAKITPVSRTENKSSLRGYASLNDDEVSTSEYGEGEKEGIISFPEIDIATDSIEVTFFGDEESFIFFKETGWDTKTGFAWYGEDFNKTSSLNLSVRNSEDGTRYAGSASIKNKVYNIVTLYDGQVRVSEVDISSFPSEPGQIYAQDGERKLVMKIDNTTDSSIRRSVAQGGNDSVVDVMCLYTPEALCRENGQKSGCDTSNSKFIATMDDKCELAMEETNTAFRMSGVGTSANLVYSGLISPDFQEEKYMCSVLENIRSSNEAVYQRVRDLREEYKADLISVIAHSVVANIGAGDFAVCGCGDIFQNNKQYAFSVVDRTCATGFYSFAHEIGHNFGCYHDPIPNAPGAAYGYKDPQSNFRTIMAYDCSDRRCPRILRFSTPDQQFSFNGKPIGTFSNNCASEINRNTVSVANFMNEVPDTNLVTTSYNSLPTTGPSLTCDKWNEVKIEIEVEMIDGANPSDISFSFFNTRFPNNNLLAQENHYLSGQMYKAETCVFSGLCFGFELQTGRKVKTYQVKVDGVSEVNGQGNFSKKVETISIDATRKKFQGKRCQWLRRRDQNTITSTCSSTFGFSRLCPKTCGSC